MSFDCVVIGGGAAGLMAAIEGKKNGLNVAIIEHTDKLANKILKTGNGKCNFSNLVMDKTKFQNDNTTKVMDVIDRFTVQDLIAFFDELSVMYKEKNGYLYPRSETAASIADALIREVNRLGVKVYFNTSVIGVNKDDEGFALKLKGESIVALKSRTIIVACGSKASPKSGSDGSGYELAHLLGNNVIKPLPALTSLVCDGKFIKTASGVRATGRVSVVVDNKEIAADSGEIQFTDYGVSGIPVFQVSRYAVRALDEKRNVKVLVKLFEDFTREELDKKISKCFERAGKVAISDALSGMINKKIVMLICKDIGIDSNLYCSKITQENYKKFIDLLYEYSYKVVGYKDFEFAQICQGGVDLEEMTEDLESMKNPGVFYAGEILDVDGKCGGYNLQWAFSSGVIAARGASKKVRE